MAAVMDGTKEELIRAAGPIFASGGFDAATVREICGAAEANVAAVNYHFGGKQELYRETVRAAAQSCMASVPLPELPSEMPTPRKLYLFIRTLLERAIVDREPMWCGQLIMREMTFPTEACADFARGFIKPHFEILQGILAEVLPGEVPPVRRRQIAFSIVGQCLHYRFCRPVIMNLVGEAEFRTFDAENLASHITEFTLAALGLAPALNRKNWSLESGSPAAVNGSLRPVAQAPLVEGRA